MLRETSFNNFINPFLFLQIMIKNLWFKLKTFFVECKRVFTITKKPGKDEFRNILKVTAIGAALIGLLGAIIQIGCHVLK